MRKVICFCLASLFLISCSKNLNKNGPHSAVNEDSVKLIGQEFFDFILRQNPLYATYIGQNQYDDRLPIITPSSRLQEFEEIKTFRDRLLAINFRNLSDADQIHFDFLRHEIETLLGTQTCEFPLWIVDQLDGAHIGFAELASAHPLKNERDFQNLLSRFRKMQNYFFDHIQNLETGRLQGLTSPQINIRHVIDQLEHQLAQKPEQSPYMINDNRWPQDWSQETITEAKKTLLRTINFSVYAGLRAYKNYLQNELLPYARASHGIKYLSLGRNCYQNLIERHTGLKKTPTEIHGLGVSEVRRIKQAMRVLIRSRSTFENENDFINALRVNPQQYLTDGQALIDHNKNLVERAQKALPKAFGRLPKTDIKVIPLESFRQKRAPVAYYYEAPANGERPAYYYLNTYQPEKRPLYNMAALAFHEAVPGHHLQIALANENKSIPTFQRHLGQTAFTEGWALYAEILSRELGLYRSVEEEFGSLNYELWRALRLVVDTGIHAHGWSREKAAQYLASNTALTQEEVYNEIDRYIIWPGQALAYKIGQMEISDLREFCQKELKDNFSIKNFHDQILKNGALPLSTLRRTTNQWLQDQLQLANK